MSKGARPHVLAVDDGPFRKHQEAPVPLVAVTMEGADLVEGVALGRFPVDGEGATEHLAHWIGGLRIASSLQAVVLGGITIAGLGIVDTPELARRLGRPVLVVTRRDPSQSRVEEALRAAGLEQRIPVVAAAPPAHALREGLFVAASGTDDATAARIVTATLRKAQLPEPLRIAHLVARALVHGESRGRA